MPDNFVADSFHTKKLCSRLSLSEVRFYTESGSFVFEPPFGELSGNVWWSSEVHWKAHSGLPISVNWNFFARCYGWVAMSEYRFKIGNFTPTGSVDPKFQVEGVTSQSHQPLYPTSQKTRLNDLSYGINIWTDLSSILSEITRVTDGQTDGQTDRRTDRQSSHR